MPLEGIVLILDTTTIQSFTLVLLWWPKSFPSGLPPGIRKERVVYGRSSPTLQHEQEPRVPTTPDHPLPSPVRSGSVGPEETFTGNRLAKDLSGSGVLRDLRSGRDSTGLPVHLKSRVTLKEVFPDSWVSDEGPQPERIELFD